jgi:hypothetical protein
MTVPDFGSQNIGMPAGTGRGAGGGAGGITCRAVAATSTRAAGTSSNVMYRDSGTSQSAQNLGCRVQVARNQGCSFGPAQQFWA